MSGQTAQRDHPQPLIGRGQIRPGKMLPKSAKRSTHANIAINITYFIPNRFRKKGISNMQSVSEICDSEIRALAWLAPNEEAKSGISLNEEINGFAKPLVICNDTPNNIEKIKNRAIRRCLKSAKARKPQRAPYCQT